MSISGTKDRYWHWVNEQIKDAVEYLEDTPQSAFLLSTHGEIKVNPSDKSLDIYWKGKFIIHVYPMEVDTQLGYAELIADLIYKAAGENNVAKLSEHNKE